MYCNYNNFVSTYYFCIYARTVPRHCTVTVTFYFVCKFTLATRKLVIKYRPLSFYYTYSFCIGLLTVLQLSTLQRSVCMFSFTCLCLLTIFHRPQHHKNHRQLRRHFTTFLAKSSKFARVRKFNFYARKFTFHHFCIVFVKKNAKIRCAESKLIQFRE